MDLNEQGPFDVWELNLEVAVDIDVAFEEHLDLPKRSDAGDGNDLCVHIEP